MAKKDLMIKKTMKIIANQEVQNSQLRSYTGLFYMPGPHTPPSTAMDVVTIASLHQL